MVVDNRLPAGLEARLGRDLASGAFGDWAPLLQRWAAGAGGRATLAAVDARVAAGAVVYPSDPLAALRLAPRAGVRVLILGQDPYHGRGQAEGLAFSVPPGCRVPPSLRNIHAELQRDLGMPAPGHGSLRAWAARGVLLLNTTLTVEDGQPASHAKLGWQMLTSAICESLCDRGRPWVVLLWGAHAQRHWQLVSAGKPAPTAVLTANHPSPLSARRPPEPFIGCGHFGLGNQALMAAGAPPVDWSLPPTA